MDPCEIPRHISVSRSTQVVLNAGAVEMIILLVVEVIETIENPSIATNHQVAAALL